MLIDLKIRMGMGKGKGKHSDMISGQGQIAGSVSG